MTKRIHLKETYKFATLTFFSPSRFQGQGGDLTDPDHVEEQQEQLYPDRIGLLERTLRLAMTSEVTIGRRSKRGQSRAEG